jgi:hypothetical protein
MRSSPSSVSNEDPNKEKHHPSQHTPNPMEASGTSLVGIISFFIQFGNIFLLIVANL